MLASPAPLSAELVLGRTPALKEPQLLNGVLHWLEQRPQEQGRTTLMARRPGAVWPAADGAGATAVFVHPAAQVPGAGG